MALSFLKYGVTPSKRNNKRKSKPTLVTWDELPTHFRNKLEDEDALARCIRETQWARDNNEEYPMECRLMFGNANVPFGYRDGIKAENQVKSVPCKDVNQGKETLEEIIQAIESDKETQKVVARFFKDRKGFDSSTIPGSLLGTGLTTTS